MEQEVAHLWKQVEDLTKQLMLIQNFGGSLQLVLDLVLIARITNIENNKRS